MAFSAAFPYEPRETVRSKLKNGEYFVKEFKCRSSVWEYFRVVTTPDGIPVNYVMCHSCNDVFTYRGHSSGTSTLRKHINKCTGAKLDMPLSQPLEIDIRRTVNGINSIMLGTVSTLPINYDLGMIYAIFIKPIVELVISFLLILKVLFVLVLSLLHVFWCLHSSSSS